MTFPQYICLFFILAVIISFLRKGRDLSSPARTFIMVWAVGLFLAEFKFSHFQSTWSLFSWFLIVIGTLSFLIGVYIPYTVNINTVFKPIKTIRDELLTKRKYKINNLFYSNILLFILYTISYIAEWQIIGQLPIFSARFDQSRTEYGVFGIHLIVNFQLIILFMSVEYLVLAKENKFKKAIMWFVFFVALLSFALLLQRFNYFMFGVMAFGFLYYGSKVITFGKVIVILLLLFGFLGIIQSIRLSQYAQQFIYVISKMKYGPQWAFITEPYMYITMNFENLAKGFAKLEDHTYGLMTADWLTALFGIKKWAIDYFNVDTKPFLNSNFNTYPFLWNYYYDFGVIGLLIFPLITGFIISTIYINMRRTGDLKWIVYYSMSLAIIVISFFTNPLNGLNFIASIFVLWFIHRFFILELV